MTGQDCQEADSRQFKAWNKNQGEGAGWGLGEKSYRVQILDSEKESGWPSLEHGPGRPGEEEEKGLDVERYES